MSINRFWGVFFMICLMTFNSCQFKRLVTDTIYDSFLYKPSDNSPAYLVQLPPGCILQGYIVGSSISYYFSYNNAFLYVSNESPMPGVEHIPSDKFSVHHYNLIKVQDSLKKHMDISCPRQGVIFEDGGDSLFWKYCFVYDLEKNDPTFGVANYGFQFIIVEYANATSEDTNVLNRYMNTPNIIGMTGKKTRLNKIVRHRAYRTR